MPFLLFLLSTFLRHRAAERRDVTEITDGKSSPGHLIWKHAAEFLLGVMIGTGILSVIWFYFVIADLDTVSLSTLRTLEGGLARMNAVGTWLKGPVWLGVVLYIGLFVLGYLSLTMSWKPGTLLARTGLKAADVYFTQLKKWVAPMAVVTSFTLLGGTFGDELTAVEFRLKSADTKLDELGKSVRRHVREHAATQIQNRVVNSRPASYRAPIIHSQRAVKMENRLRSDRELALKRYEAKAPHVDSILAVRASRESSAREAVETALKSDIASPDTSLHASRNKLSVSRLNRIIERVERWSDAGSTSNELLSALGKPLPGKVLSAVFTPKNMPVEFVAHLAADYPVANAFFQVFANSINDHVKSRIEPLVAKYTSKLITDPPDTVESELGAEVQAIADSAPVRWSDQEQNALELAAVAIERQRTLILLRHEADNALSLRKAEIHAANERAMTQLRDGVGSKLALSDAARKSGFTNTLMRGINEIPDPATRRDAISRTMERLQGSSAEPDDLIAGVTDYVRPGAVEKLKTFAATPATSASAEVFAGSGGGLLTEYLYWKALQRAMGKEPTTAEWLRQRRTGEAGVGPGQTRSRTWESGYEYRPPRPTYEPHYTPPVYRPPPARPRIMIRR